MTESEPPRFTVYLTRAAEKDHGNFKGKANENVEEALRQLEHHPHLGEPLAGNLAEVRSLHFSLKGSGQHRAAYVVLLEQQECVVFLIASRENFYREAERRYRALRRSSHQP